MSTLLIDPIERGVLWTTLASVFPFLGRGGALVGTKDLVGDFWSARTL